MQKRKVMLVVSGKASALLLETLKRSDLEKHNLELFHYCHVKNNRLPKRKDLKKANESDVIILQGTWGSKLRKYKKEINDSRQAILDCFNSKFAKIAKKRSIPLIVIESATLSRFRQNYLDIDVKLIDPRYYRMAKDHWIYGKAKWINPKTEQRLYQLNKYDIDIDFNNHTWRNNLNGAILILAGLEFDPTNEYDIELWIQKSIQKIRKVTNRAILVKPHPLSNLKFENISIFSDVYLISPDLKIKNLADYCKVAVINQSTSLFELTELGIICFTDKTNFGAELGNTDLKNIENPYYPSIDEYLEWINKMSYTEFSIFEYNSEIILEYLNELITL